MPFFEVKKKQYPGSTTAADNLSKRFSLGLLEGVVKTMQEWVEDDRKPGRQEVELVGSKVNAEMVRDVEGRTGRREDPLDVTRCWVAVRKCGYKQMRDEKFGLFVDDVLEAVERRRK